MNTIGIFAGSFDPITFGHIWMIQKSIKLVDKLYVAVGVNPSKKYYFSNEERMLLVKESLRNNIDIDDFDRIEIIKLDNELLVNKARELKATHLIRGLRDGKDFEYERQIQIVNSKMAPEIETVYFVTPTNLTEVSSSIVKGLVGYVGWESIVSQYVDSIVVNTLKAKMGE